ncbi:MAG: dihydrofolate reductase [Rikenellaceae bacterium]
MKLKHLIPAMASMALLQVGCGTEQKTAVSADETFEWQIDKFDDINILRYKVDGFESLSLDQKKLIYYLSKASITGRDILFDQNFKYNLPLKKALESLYVNFDGDRSDSEFLAFEKYLKKIWFANGVHHHYSEVKFTPEFSVDFFEKLLTRTPQDKWGATSKEMEILGKVIFDSTFYPKRLNQAEGVDLVLTSAVNFYEGVTEKEVEKYYASIYDSTDMQPISYGLNTTVVKENGKIVEKPWKVDGIYSEPIKETIKWLEKAVTVAENDHQRQTIEALIKQYETGSLKDYDTYNVLWTKDNGGQIDFVNGFTETYTDPLGRKATWEGIVNFKDIEASERTRIISENAEWFEKNSPIDDKYKKDHVKGISAKVITVAMLGGDCYPATPIGINLPNADWIRRDHGSKSVTIANITDAYEQASQGNGFAEEFLIDDIERGRKAEYGSLANNLHTDLHECLGHASGKLAEGVKGDELKNYSSTLEEARADLFALYYIADPKMIELGIVPSEELAKETYYNSIMNGALTQITRVNLGDDIEEAHMRDRAVIANWAIDMGKEDKVIEMVKIEGKTYVKINDYAKLRTIFGEQLKEVQRIKSEGDYDACKALIEKYGVKIDPELHKEVLARYKALGVAPYSGFVNPQYNVIEENGEIVDITLSYTQGYVEQMLEYGSEMSFL